MREAIEAKIKELEAVTSPSPFQAVARGSLLGALSQVRNAEDNLRYHDEAQAKAAQPSASAKAAAHKSENPKS